VFPFFILADVRQFVKKISHHAPQQKVYASCGFGVGIKFSFLNFVQPRGTKTRFEIRSRHKLKRWRQALRQPKK